MTTLQTNLESSINGVSSVQQSNYYNKTSVDASLLLKSDKTYVGTSLTLKANAVDVYTKTTIDTKLLKQVLYDYDINNVRSSISANRIIAVDQSTNPNALVDIQTNTRVIGVLTVTND